MVLYLFFFFFFSILMLLLSLLSLLLLYNFCVSFFSLSLSHEEGHMMMTLSFVL